MSTVLLGVVLCFVVFLTHCCQMDTEQEKTNTNLVLFYRWLWSYVPFEMVLGTLEICRPCFKNCSLEAWPCPASTQARMTSGNTWLKSSSEQGIPLKVITEPEKFFLLWFERKKSSQRLMHLNTWFLVGWHCVGRLWRGVALMEEVCYCGQVLRV